MNMTKMKATMIKNLEDCMVRGDKQLCFQRNKDIFRNAGFMAFRRSSRGSARIVILASTAILLLLASVTLWLGGETPSETAIALDAGKLHKTTGVKTHKGKDHRPSALYTAVRDPKEEGTDSRDPGANSLYRHSGSDQPTLTNDKAVTKKTYSGLFGTDTANSGRRPDNRPGSDLSIAGGVVDELGQPVPDILIIAAAQHLDTGTDGAADPAQQTGDQPGDFKWQGRTDGQGAFALSNLPAGDYQVRTGAMRGIPSVGTVVRAGVMDVKLVVAAKRNVVVFGTITTPEGKPVAKAQVASTNRNAVSDASGNYALKVAVNRQQSFMLQFHAEGYSDNSLTLSADDLGNVEQVQRNVVMTPSVKRTTVSGLLSNSWGQPLPRETVNLQYPDPYLKYEAVTDQSGQFVFRDVDSGFDYFLWIRPKSAYKDYHRGNLQVPAEGVTGLAIALDPVSRGRLSGRMVDPEGKAVPGFSLTVSARDSGEAPITVTGDANGQFFIDSAPAGSLNLGTISEPRFIASGITLPPGGEENVNVVFDLGPNGLEGLVVDGNGVPVPAANVTLSWVHREDNGQTSESMRTTVSGAQGHFAFSQLGRGPHTIIVQAPGYARAEQTQEVGGAGEMAVQVQLAKLPSS